MRIALAQCNFHIGNFSENTSKIITCIQNAKLENADLVVFSELSICGYPPLDLLEQKDFIESCTKQIEIIAQECDTIAVILGAPTINPNDKGKQLYNSAICIENKKIIATVHKTLLPTYDIFDEYRYFEPNTEFSIVTIKNKRIALTICEDIWDKQVVESSFAKSTLYAKAPMDFLHKQNPDFMINIAASPFSYNQENLRTTVLKDNALRYNLPIVYVNQIGANTEIIFDGTSKVVNAQGCICEQLPAFTEALHVIDTETAFATQESKEEQTDKIAHIHDALLLGIRDFFAKNKFTKATLGLSGGIDSAVVLGLIAQVLEPTNIHVLLLPSQFSSQHSIDDAITLAENLGVSYTTIPISNTYESMIADLQPLFKDLPFNIAEENIQARIRGILLMAVSNKFGNILLNTSNKSEAAVGYSTMYGDMNGSLSILGDVYKSDVYNLANYINRNSEIIPQNTITKAPSAELRPDQKDSDSLPEYDILDGILFNFIEKKLSFQEIVDLGYNPETVRKTLTLVNNNEYKRFQFPPILRISSKAFGFGRRIPLVAIK